jgi:DnaK suppressor protein
VALNLKALREKAVLEIDELTINLGTVSSRVPDANDAGSIVEQQLALQNQLRFKEQYLVRVNIAISKLAKGEFGFCDECGIDIPIARLDKVPDAACCVECQTIREYREKVATFF